MKRFERFEPLVSAIQEARTFLICTHEAPEGDCLGASLGLGYALESLGKQVRHFNPEPVPRQCQFLEGWQRFESILPTTPFDLVFVVDCADISRTGPQHKGIRALGPVFNIDHHGTNTHFGAQNVVDGTASSTCELIYELLMVLKIPLSPLMAECLYTGLMIDTGCFRYSNTSVWTMDVARELMSLGANPARVGNGLYETMSPACLRLLPRVLDSVRFEAGGKIASIHVTRDMLNTAGAILSDTEGFINYPRGVDGVEIAVFFKEMEGALSVSLRAKQSADIGAVAKAMGGGGHRLAAGFSTQEPLEQVRARLMPLLKKALADVQTSAH